MTHKINPICTVLLTVIATFFSSTVKAQTTVPSDTIYKIAVIEEQPAFPGGEVALFKYLGENIKYPVKAREKNIQGTVYVRFTIDKDGSVVDVSIKRGIGGGCDEEALKAVNAMPKWKPGTQQGDPVKVKYTMPVKFGLAPITPIIDETVPNFKGGERFLATYITTHIQYPVKEYRKKIEGTVIVSFTVAQNGAIKDATVTQSLTKKCDAEALRMVKTMPKWIPAKKNGIPIDAKYLLPVKFKLK